MGKATNVCIAAMLAMAPLVASARPPEGFWFADLALTKEKLSATDQDVVTTICRRLQADGFYALSFLVVVEIEGSTLQVRGVGGGPSQSATLQNEDAKTGRLLYRSLPASAEKVELEIVPQSHGALQMLVAGRHNPELNALQWVRKSKEDIARMDASLLTGKGDFFKDMFTVCQE